MPRARRDESRLPRSMHEAVSSGSATGHGDGPEPLWPRRASGDLRPAPAGNGPVNAPQSDRQHVAFPHTRGSTGAAKRARWGTEPATQATGTDTVHDAPCRRRK